MARLAATALFVATAFQAGSLAWKTLSPGDPGCAIYEETAGKRDRVALSGAEAVDALFDVMQLTHDSHVRAGLQGVLDAGSTGDVLAMQAAQEEVMRACGLTGIVRGYEDFQSQLTEHLG